MLITKGLAELVHIGKVLGSEVHSFLGLAGIGDLIATCMGESSRNFRVGYGLSQGKKLKDILNELGEVAEGVNTIRITKALMDHLKQPVPIVSTLYDVLFEEKPIKEAIKYLMEYKIAADVDFL